MQLYYHELRVLLYRVLYVGLARSVLVPVLMVPVPVVPVDLRFIYSRTGTTCVMHHYFTTREACEIPTHTSGIIGHS